MKASFAIALLFVIACTTAAPPPKPAGEFRNLQVLPQDIPREELMNTMRGFTRALGVRCDHCHVATQTTPKMELDFASDAKETKKNARVMLRMTMEINRTWLPRLTPAEADRHAGCWTCHRGKPEPESPPPPPAEGQRPGA